MNKKFIANFKGLNVGDTMSLTQEQNGFGDSIYLQICTINFYKIMKNINSRIKGQIIKMKTDNDCHFFTVDYKVNIDNKYYFRHFYFDLYGMDVNSYANDISRLICEFENDYLNYITLAFKLNVDNKEDILKISGLKEIGENKIMKTTKYIDRMNKLCEKIDKVTTDMNRVLSTFNFFENNNKSDKYQCTRIITAWQYQGINKTLSEDTPEWFKNCIKTYNTADNSITINTGYGHCQDVNIGDYLLIEDDGFINVISKVVFEKIYSPVCIKKVSDPKIII